MEIRVPMGPEQAQQTSSTGTLVAGILMMVVAFVPVMMSTVAYNPDPSDFGSDMDNQFATVAALMGVVMLIIGGVLILYSRVLKDQEASRLEAQARAEEEARQRNIQDIAAAMKSNIKVRCRYCGSLNDEDATKCDSCGGTL